MLNCFTAFPLDAVHAAAAAAAAALALLSYSCMGKRERESEERSFHCDLSVTYRVTKVPRGENIEREERRRGRKVKLHFTKSLVIC